MLRVDKERRSNLEYLLRMGVGVWWATQHVSEWVKAAMSEPYMLAPTSDGVYCWCIDLPYKFLEPLQWEQNASYVRLHHYLPLFPHFLPSRLKDGLLFSHEELSSLVINSVNKLVSLPATENVIAGKPSYYDINIGPSYFTIQTSNKQSITVVTWGTDRRIITIKYIGIMKFYIETSQIYGQY